MIQSQSYARKESHTDWSISELKSLCLKLLGNSAASFCVFVDGLDELDPSEYFYDLWVLIQSMQAAAPGRLKLCLSSRPEPDIRCYLGRFPGLKVQDLNRQDLEEFAADQLEARLFTYLNRDHQHSNWNDLECGQVPRWRDVKSELAEHLVNCAEGVFPWLFVAVRRVKQSLTSRRKIEEIRQEIDFMPDKIEDMYRQMWSKLAKDQRDPRPARAALYFKMCMIEKDHSQQYFLNLLLVALGSTDHKLHLPAFEDNLIDRLGSLLGTCEFIEENIDNDSLGFIDRVYRGEEEAMLFRMHREGYMETIAFGPVNLVWGNETHKGCEELIRYANDDMVFRFVHRSVYDFLTDTEEGTRLLERCQLSIEDIHEKLIEATRFEYWTDRIVLLHGCIHPADRVQFHEDTFSMVTPLSITLADGVNAFYEDTYKQRHTGVVQTSRPAWTYFLARCQFFLDGECSIHDEILLWIGHPDSEAFQTTYKAKARFLRSYIDHRYGLYGMENQDTIAICVLSFPIALVLRYILQALKCWEPTSWIKDLPAFASLEKVAMSQDGIASQHKTAESPVQPLILVNKRIHDLHEVERYYEG
ncbi:hypothetical protein MCOR31_008352 [Pyricularia oryzae]|nr:hypothetical protein MCOR31_008352 [Pyricularia oryzae]